MRSVGFNVFPIESLGLPTHGGKITDSSIFRRKTLAAKRVASVACIEDPLFYHINPYP
jgi:hypothetical protein